MLEEGVLAWLRSLEEITLDPSGGIHSGDQQVVACWLRYTLERGTPEAGGVYVELVGRRADQKAPTVVLADRFFLIPALRGEPEMLVPVAFRREMLACPSEPVHRPGMVQRNQETAQGFVGAPR